MDDELEAKDAEKHEEAKQLVVAGIQGPMFFMSTLSATDTPPATPRNGVAPHPMRFGIPAFSYEVWCKWMKTGRYHMLARRCHLLAPHVCLFDAHACLS